MPTPPPWHTLPVDLVEVTPDLLVPQRISVRIADDPEFEHDFELSATWNDEAIRYDIDQLAIRQRVDGAPVTTETMRAVPVHRLLQRVIADSVVISSRTIGQPPTRHVTVDPKLAKLLRGDGPKWDTLRWVARVYRLAQIRLEPPTRAVAETFGIPHRTASYWIRLAHERGAFIPEPDLPDWR